MYMKSRCLHIVIMTIIIVSLSCCSSKDKQNAPSKDAIDLVKTEIQMFSKHLPIEGGLGLIITDVNYDEANYTIHYKYKYTVPGVRKPSDSQISEAKANAVTLMKTQPKEKSFWSRDSLFDTIIIILMANFYLPKKFLWKT